MGTTKRLKKQQAPEHGVVVLDSPQDAPPVPVPIDLSATTTLLQETRRAAGAVWLRQQRVTALWSNVEERNSWVAIHEIGWKKLADSSPSANHVLTLLASQALQSNRLIDYREDGDGMIHEIYVW
jgi:hypothetical protein